MNSNVYLALSVLIGSSALGALIVKDVRKRAFLLWLSGIGVGSVFLCFKLDYLAFVQWTISTLVAFSYLSHGNVFGIVDSSILRGKAIITAAVVTGLFFILFVSFETFQMIVGPFSKGLTIEDIGRKMSTEYFFEVFLFSLMMLSVVVGVGVMARRGD